MSIEAVEDAKTPFVFAALYAMLLLPGMYLGETCFGGNGMWWFGSFFVWLPLAPVGFAGALVVGVMLVCFRRFAMKRNWPLSATFAAICTLAMCGGILFSVLFVRFTAAKEGYAFCAFTLPMITAAVILKNRLVY